MIYGEVEFDNMKDLENQRIVRKGLDEIWLNNIDYIIN